jgi:hypothetical protein
MNKKDFLKKEFVVLSINAAFQRNQNVYKEQPNELIKAGFRDFLERFLAALPLYELTEKRLYKIIDDLTIKTREYRDILKLGQLNYGTAQKLVNLYLKYLWCLDMAPEPPHCPIDRIILGKAKISDVSWTKINSREEYKSIVNKIKIISKDLSIAQWELENFNRR